MKMNKTTFFGILLFILIIFVVMASTPDFDNSVDLTSCISSGSCDYSSATSSQIASAIRDFPEVAADLTSEKLAGVLDEDLTLMEKPQVLDAVRENLPDDDDEDKEPKFLNNNPEIRQKYLLERFGIEDNGNKPIIEYIKASNPEDDIAIFENFGVDQFSKVPLRDVTKIKSNGNLVLRNGMIIEDMTVTSEGNKFTLENNGRGIIILPSPDEQQNYEPSTFEIQNDQHFVDVFIEDNEGNFDDFGLFPNNKMSGCIGYSTCELVDVGLSDNAGNIIFSVENKFFGTRNYYVNSEGRFTEVITKKPFLPESLDLRGLQFETYEICNEGICKTFGEAYASIGEDTTEIEETFPFVVLKIIPDTMSDFARIIGGFFPGDMEVEYDYPE